MYIDVIFFRQKGVIILLKLTNIEKIYHTGDEDIRALKNINLSFEHAQFVSVLGPSGCGKTTLLNVIGGLSRYNSGDLKISTLSTKDYKEEDWDSYRNHQIGFVFQSYNLISHLSVLGNVELALSLSGQSVSKRRQKARDMLKRVGLSDKINKRPNQLSNGQLQRVAIARALVNDPKIILADEPTGALDTETSIQIMDLLKELSFDKLVIVVTHNEELANTYSDRIIKLLDGEVIEDNKLNDDLEKPKLDFKSKVADKTYMGFGTAIKLSFFNMVKKYIKTIISTIAGGIGIIGVALVIGISTGFTKYVEIVQLTSNTNTPVVIRNKTVIEAFPDPDKPAATLPNRFPSNQNYITPLQTSIPMIYEEVVNFITPEYLNYLDNLNSQKYHQIKYYYDLNYPTFLRKDQDGEFHTVNYSASTVADIGEIPYDDASYLNQIFDVLAGQMPKNVVSEQRVAEAVLIVNDRNQLSDTMLNRLGFNLDLNELDTYNKQISFDELLNLNLKLAHSGVIYDKDEDSGIYLRRSNEDIYNDEKIITLKIVGILRRKQNASIPQYQGIRYTSGVNTFILNETKNSPIIREQQEIIDQHFQDGSPITSVLTGQQITENEAIVLLRKLGISQEPSRIVIFHINGEARQDIVNYLEAYNNDKVGDKRIFLDQSNISETWIVDGTLTSIKTVLIFVASIALFISISLLAILTYLSVIERTDEIGILRSIGARRKDIVRVFNAEAFIIGIFSGIFGLILTYSLLPVFNSIFEAALRVNQLIVIDTFLAGVLLLGNILLTLLIGLIPSLLASYKDPIDALKSLQ